MLGSERTKLKFSHANTGVVTKARVIAKVSIGPRADLASAISSISPKTTSTSVLLESG